MVFLLCKISLEYFWWINSPLLNKDNIKTQCYIKVIKINISFSIDIESSSLKKLHIGKWIVKGEKQHAPSNNKSILLRFDIFLSA